MATIDIAMESTSQQILNKLNESSSNNNDNSAYFYEGFLKGSNNLCWTGDKISSAWEDDYGIWVYTANGYLAKFNKNTFQHLGTIHVRSSIISGNTNLSSCRMSLFTNEEYVILIKSQSNSTSTTYYQVDLLNKTNLSLQTLYGPSTTTIPLTNRTLSNFCHVKNTNQVVFFDYGSTSNYFQIYTYSLANISGNPLYQTSFQGYPHTTLTSTSGAAPNLHIVGNVVRVGALGQFDTSTNTWSQPGSPHLYSYDARSLIDFDGTYFYSYFSGEANITKSDISGNIVKILPFRDTGNIISSVSKVWSSQNYLFLYAYNYGSGTTGYYLYIFDRELNFVKKIAIGAANSDYFQASSALISTNDTLYLPMNTTFVGMPLFD